MRTPLIYVVDDESAIVETVSSLLRREGYAVRGFVRPLEALVAAESQPPDLLFTDVMMPEMDGFALVEQVRSRWPRCAVVMISGHAAEHEVRAKGFGHKILAKPTTLHEIMRAVKEALTRQGYLFTHRS